MDLSIFFHWNIATDIFPGNDGTYGEEVNRKKMFIVKKPFHKFCKK